MSTTEPTTPSGREILAIHWHEAHSPDAKPDAPCNMRLLLVKAEREAGEAALSQLATATEEIKILRAAVRASGNAVLIAEQARIIHQRDAELATATESLDEVLGADTYRLRVDGGSQCKFCADPLTWHEKGDCTWRKAEKSLANLSTAATEHDERIRQAERERLRHSHARSEQPRQVFRSHLAPEESAK
jgi:hypothetical protein